MTYRERREARADRLRGWAAKREERASADLATGDQYRGDIAFNTQPGHIPERARLIAREDRAYASLAKAASMSARAATIEAQADRAIYSDDPDAPERLRERIAELEAERARIVAYNAAVRKAGKVTPEALALLDDAQRADLDVIARVAAYQLRAGGQFPSYATSNLSGTIGAVRKRIARLAVPERTCEGYLPAAER